MKIVSAKNPRWTSAAHTAIDLLVTFEELSGELPYTAILSDCEPHGTELFQRASSGEWGAVADPASTPPPTIDQAKKTALSSLAAYRYQREISGVTVGGVLIKTDRDSQAMISGALAYSAVTPDARIEWKGGDGWTTVDRPGVIVIAQAVGAHVQACFSRERTHAEAIMALTTVEAVLAYDFSGGW